MLSAECFAVAICNGKAAAVLHVYDVVSSAEKMRPAADMLLLSFVVYRQLYVNIVAVLAVAVLY